MARPKKKRAPAPKREVRPGRVKRQREESESEDEAPAKRQKVTWRGWRDVFPIGTEWENMKGLDEVEWDFGHLREDMLHGELSALNDPVYFFCSTERTEAPLLPYPMLLPYLMLFPCLSPFCTLCGFTCSPSLCCSSRRFLSVTHIPARRH